MTPPDWEHIAHTLALAISRIEDEPFRLKNWHYAYDAMQEYKQAARITRKHDDSPEIA